MSSIRASRRRRSDRAFSAQSQAIGKVRAWLPCSMTRGALCRFTESNSTTLLSFSQASAPGSFRRCKEWRVSRSLAWDPSNLAGEAPHSDKPSCQRERRPEYRRSLSPEDRRRLLLSGETHPERRVGMGDRSPMTIEEASARSIPADANHRSGTARNPLREKVCFAQWVH